MKDLLTYIVKTITKTEPQIDETIDENHIGFDIKAKSDVMGLLIGKGGNTIKAMRNLLKVMAVLEQKSVSLTVSELPQE